MVRKSFFVLLACFVLWVQARAQDVAGDWQGTLDAGGTKLRVVFHLTKSDSGGVKGTMDSPDQGGYGIPIASVEANNGMLKLEASKIGGRFEGRFSADGKTIDGTWSQGSGSLPLILNRQTAAEAAAATPAKKLGGPAFPGEETWGGTLQTGGASLRLILHLAKAEGGGLKAALDSVDQGAYGIAVASATEKDSKLKLELPAIGASYEGNISSDRTIVDGSWSQGGGSLPLIFKRQGANSDGKKNP